MSHRQCDTTKYRHRRVRERRNALGRAKRQREIDRREHEHFRKMADVAAAREAWQRQALREDPRFWYYQRLHDILKVHLEARPLYRISELAHAVFAFGRWW